MSDEGGRIFFSSTGRSLEVEDEIRLTSVARHRVSTSTRLSRPGARAPGQPLRRRERKVLHESDVLLIPIPADANRSTRRVGASRGQYWLRRSTRRRSIPGADPHRGSRVRAREHRARSAAVRRAGGQVRVADGAEDALEATLCGPRLRRLRALDRESPGDERGHRRRDSKIAVCRCRRDRRADRLDVGARILAFDAGGA